MKIAILLILCILLSACNLNRNDKNISSIFEKSFKEQKERKFIEYLDTATNIYSNFKYYVAFDAPDKWKTDAGVSEHTIFRCYEPDSSITFAINVIDPKLNNRNEEIDIWELYQKNKQQMDNNYLTIIGKQLNAEIKNLTTEKTYLRNHPSLKRKFNFNIKDLNNEYNNTNISCQTFANNFTYTFTLNVPTLFFNKNPEYYEKLFGQIYFLKNEERLNEAIRKIK